MYKNEIKGKTKEGVRYKMEITSEEIRTQINILKKQIEENKPKETIKAEQKKLNEMLQEYLKNRN